MAGLETLAVVGILANLAAITRFCSIVVEQGVAFHRSKEVPRALRSLQVVLPLIELTLEKTQNSGDAGKLEARTCEKLIPVVEDCKMKLEELKAKLQHMIPADDASKPKTLWKQFWGQIREKEINALANDIMRSHLLIHQAGAVVPTSNEVTAVTTKVDFRLDERIEDMIKQLLVRDDCPVQVVPPKPPRID
jgi:N-terminal domain on NACHT_NTPase and P-loop NTPases